MQGGTKSNTSRRIEQTIPEAFKGAILTPTSSRSSLVSLIVVLKSQIVFNRQEITQYLTHELQ